jgi:hypothetical protein
MKGRDEAIDNARYNAKQLIESAQRQGTPRVQPLAPVVTARPLPRAKQDDQNLAERRKS